jgi:hypothetical protein
MQTINNIFVDYKIIKSNNYKINHSLKSSIYKINQLYKINHLLN